MLSFLYYALEVLKWLIVLRALLSWFVAPDSAHPLVELLRRVTDPVLRPIEAVIPFQGGINLSPIVAFLVIIALQSFLLRGGF